MSPHPPIDALRAACAALPTKGDSFERLTEDLLREIGFVNVRRQNAGTQFGRDINADRAEPSGPATQWYFECKNWIDPVGISEIGAKLIWHLGKLNLTGGFVIVGPGTLSNEVREMLADHPFQFPIYDWTGEYFARLVTLCPSTAARWFPATTLPSLSPPERELWRDLLFECGVGGSGLRSEARLRAHIEVVHNPPFQQAYMLVDDALLRLDTDARLEHRLCWSNLGDSDAIVHGIRVRSIGWAPLPPRLLLLRKMKGEFDPLILPYDLPDAGDEVELLQGRMRRLRSGEAECHILRLCKSARAGLHDVEIVVDYSSNGKQHSAVAGRFRVCVGANDAPSDVDTLPLFVFRRYYDQLAKRVLQLPNEWERIRASLDKNWIVYLGPTQRDPDQNGDTRGVPWGVRRLRIEPFEGDPCRAALTSDIEEILPLGQVPGEIHPEPLPGAYVVHLEELASFYGIPIEQLRQKAMATFATEDDAVNE